MFISFLFSLSLFQNAYAKNFIAIQQQADKSRLEKACTEVIDNRSVQIATQFEKSVLDRTALFDIAHPKDKNEENELDCNAVLLIAASTQKKEELPINAKVPTSNLSLIKCIEPQPFSEKISQIIGKYRTMCFYAIPLTALQNSGELLVDWKKNRLDQKIAKFPLKDINEFHYTCTPKNKVVQINSFKKILKREYCLEL